MFSLAQHVRLEVACPDCPESYEVPLEIVAESQRLLDESGPCSGMASYECPAPYFAALVRPETIALFMEAMRAVECDALGRGVNAVKIEESAAVDVPPLDAPVKKVAEAIALARDLSRWENEGGAA